MKVWFRQVIRIDGRIPLVRNGSGAEWAKAKLRLKKIIICKQKSRKKKKRKKMIIDSFK